MNIQKYIGIKQKSFCGQALTQFSIFFNKNLVHTFTQTFLWRFVLVCVPEVKMLGQKYNNYKFFYVNKNIYYIYYLFKEYIYYGREIYRYIFQILIILICSSKGCIILISPHPCFTEFSQSFQFLTVQLLSVWIQTLS